MHQHQFIPIWKCGESYVTAKNKVQRDNMTHPLEGCCVTSPLPLLKAAARNTKVWSEAAFQATAAGRVWSENIECLNSGVFPLRKKEGSPAIGMGSG